MNQAHPGLEIKWSEEDGCYIARSPEHKEIAAHGDSWSEAFGEFMVAFELFGFVQKPCIDDSSPNG